MKVSYLWLKSYFAQEVSFEEIINSLSRLGFGIDSVEKVGLDAEGVFSAKILKIEKHPNADKLSVCQVDNGKEVLTVVCGARNIFEGQIVPLAADGAKLKGQVLKKTKIRGVESNGMICSAAEIGLSGVYPEGILELDKNSKLAVSISEFFPKSDYVFELEITPNLAYCLSHYALARELSVFKGYKLADFNIPAYQSQENGDFKIEIENGEDCYRYAGLVIKNVQNKATPAFIAERLKAVGVNPKGDILIDVSNYVMFELGQPTHCFDLENLEGAKIKVRRAFEGETIKTLDEKEQKLSKDILVIADDKKPVAVAGVMGGFYSSISAKTCDILIESAHFNPSAVRKSSKFLNLKSDSSFRFERGVDSSLQLKAAFRIANIILSANPQAKLVQVLDNIKKEISSIPITVNHEKINSILGSALSFEKIDGVLKALNPSYSSENFIPPSHRFDLKTIYDLAEEVARFEGYDVIETKTSMPVMPAIDNPISLSIGHINKTLIACGFCEVINYDLVSLKDIKLINFAQENCVELKNPLSSDYHYLRPSLVLGLLKNLKHNVNRGAKTVKIYENGAVFSAEGISFKEKNFTASLMWGNFYGEHWRLKAEPCDFYHIKGALESVFSNMGNLVFLPDEKNAFLDKSQAVKLVYAGRAVGFAGLVSQNILRDFDIKEKNAFYFEFDSSVFSSLFSRDFHKTVNKALDISPYQQSSRDLSVIADKKYSWEDIKKEVSNVKDLLWVRLIDVYSGKNIPENLRSLTMRFMFSSAEKTFTDEELNQKIEEAFLKISKKFGVSLRS